MAAPMTTFGKRRQTNTLVTLALGALLLLVYSLFGFRFPRLVFVSGWTLLALMLFLAAYNGRKKLPFLPLSSSETWLEIHIYGGLLAALVFGMHMSFRVPTGVFENILALLFVLVTLSGIAGLWITRIFPKRLTARGGEVILERIPFERRALQLRARDLAITAVDKTRSTTVADFYAANLETFFIRPANFWSHLVESKIRPSRLLNQVNEMKRYLNEEERQIMTEMGRLMEAKITLDYHYSLQMALKLWLFIHIPLTYGLLVFSAVHVALVYAFSSASG
jgi:hypothetical protein